ncbi:MAG: EAL domain-containing protein [Pseudodesulfovibrio sp.]
MAAKNDVPVDEKAILRILQTNNIHTLFQPIVSVVTKSVIGFEAYSRGGNGLNIGPEQLFHEDLSLEIKLGVDRLCRVKALELFKPIYDSHKGLLLFLNINPSIFKVADLTADVFLQQVVDSGIDPKYVVAETLLSHAAKGEVLAIAAKAKSAGFRIGLDGCCADDSFSHVISLLEPDFVKINSSFYGKDARKDHAADALDVLLSVAERVGTAIIAHGVENEEDSVRLLAAGVHIQQGYHYSKDDADKAVDAGKNLIQKLNKTYDTFKRVKGEVVRNKKDRLNGAFKAATSVCHKLANMSEDRFEETSLRLVGEGGKLGDIFSLFVLNKKGVQITPRVHIKPKDGWLGSNAVLGTRRGVDHSMRNYVIYLDMGYENFVTKPFTSAFNGKEACIVSKPFFNYEGTSYTLCMEVPYPG